MGMVLTIVGAASFVGYLIWLIVRIVQWDSKIPPIIGMLLSVVMVFGGLSTFSGSDDAPSKKTDSPEKPASTETVDLMTESEVKEMYSSPSKFKNRSLELFGKVFATPEYDKDAVYFQMWADPENSELNTFVKYEDPSVDLKDGTYIKLKGVVYGSIEGTNAFGAKVTGPQIVADSLEVVSYQDAVAPAIHTIMLEEPTQTQLGYSVTIEKVELAEKETRVYIKVENNGSDKFNLYSFNSIIIQDGKQYEEETNYSADYPQVQTGLSVGVTTEGIFCYPAIESKSFTVVLDGSSENYREEIKPFSFEITI